MAIELAAGFEVDRSALPPAALRKCARRKALHRLPLGRGAGMVRGRPLPGVVGHPQRPHAALGRDRRLGVGVPPAGDEHQRPHRRPAGPAGLVRASRPLRVAHRARRHAHGARDRISKASASTRRTTWSSSRDGSIWFTDPSYGIDTDYEGDAAPSEIGDAMRLSHRRRTSVRLHGVATTSCSPTASPSRRTSRCCTSPTPAPRTWPTGRTTSAAFASRTTGATLTGGEVFAHLPGNGLFDGFRVDVHGNLWLQRRRRRALLHARRRAARQDPIARGGGQRLLRRAEAQPPVHLRHDVAVRGVPECPCRPAPRRRGQVTMELYV